MSKTMTADDILNESDSDSEDDVPQSKPQEDEKSKSPSKPSADEEPSSQVKEGFMSKLSTAVKDATDVVTDTLDRGIDKIQDALSSDDDKNSKEGDNNDDADQAKPSRAALRAYQAEAFKSFSAGISIEQKHREEALKKAATSGKEGNPAGDDHISEEERQKILMQIEQEDSDEDSDNDRSSSDESDSQNQNAKNKDGDSDSLLSDQDFLNRSLHDDDDVDQQVVDPENYLRYASEKFNAKFDMMDVIDKNERSFKRVAEKMIQQSSQLVTLVKDAPQQRRLMSQNLYSKIADRFHGDINVAQGVPYCIAAIEDFIAIGSSDGSVRLFSQQEEEIKTLIDKTVKGNAVTCLDIKRMQKDQNLFIISGHSKGQIALYELKGLLTRNKEQLEKHGDQLNSKITDNPMAWYNTNKEKFRDAAFGNIQFKHHKTVDDAHKAAIVSVKFVGDFSGDIQVISCDLNGTVCLTLFKDTVMFYRTDVKPILVRRLSASFCLAPLVMIGASWKSDEIQTATQKSSNPFYNNKDIQAEGVVCQICAFGTLEEVYACQVLPDQIPLLSIRRPAYVSAGSVPYLDWGNALTPTFRDRAYPVLAIAWGRTIQLAVYSNDKEVKRGLEEPMLQLDGFYICDGLSVDSVFFLSESLLFILVNKKEVRILYTQNFTPGVFDENYASNDLVTRKIGADAQAENEQNVVTAFQLTKEKYAGSVKDYAEKDCGFRMLDEELRHKDNAAAIPGGEIRSKFNFNATLCKNYDFNVIALGKTQIGQRTLIHWEEYLDFVDKTNPNEWLKVLRAALEVFNGKIVGLAGLPDSVEKRQSLLRERMKSLLRSNLDAVIREFQEGECVSMRTLRVATEFCIRVGAIDHIFGELFYMFSNAGVEQRYFENLDAFILSGKLSKVKIPVTILDRLISFYYHKDVELLEKAILNLNLKHYPDALNVRQICEQEFLSSALIHLLNTMFEEEQDMANTTCLSILCALFNLMTRCTNKKTPKDVQSLLVYQERFGTSIFEMTSSDAAKIQEEETQAMHRKSRNLKIEIERSSTYIGYKLLWVIQLFLEGKKFPAGSLSSDNWRYFVYDVVRFCTNEKFMQWFLEFDAEAYFQILRKLFNDPEPSEYIRTQEKFIASQHEKNPFLEPCFTHMQILCIVENKVNQIVQTMARENFMNAAKAKTADDANDSDTEKDQALKKDDAADEEDESRSVGSDKVDETIMNGVKGAVGQLTAKSEAIHNAWIFFLLSIGKNKKIDVPKEMGLRVVADQIKFHKKLFRKVDKQDLQDLIPETMQARREKDRTCNIYTYLVRKNEKDIIQLLSRYQQDLEEEDLQMLQDEANGSPLFKLKIYLNQHQGDFQKCLTQFFQVKAIKSDLFAWLSDVQKHLITSNSSAALSDDQASQESTSTSASAQNQSSKDLADEEDDSTFFDIRGVPSRFNYLKMKEIIMSNISDFVAMDPLQTVNICDQWFDRDFMKIAERLEEHKDLAFKFLDTVLKQNEKRIVEEYNENILHNRQETISSAQKQLLTKLIEIICDRKLGKSSDKSSSANSLLVDYVSREYFPVQACLEICERKHMKEACAVLNKRKGDHQQALKLYFEALVELCVENLILTIDVEKYIKFQDPQCNDKHMQQFDFLLMEIITICDKVGSRMVPTDMENLWQIGIKGLFSIQNQVFTKLQAKDQKRNAADSETDSDDEQEKVELRALFTNFMLIRKQKFMQRMCEHVNLTKIITFLQENEPNMKYCEFQDTFEGKLQHESISVEILRSAKRLIDKEVLVDVRDYQILQANGFNSLTKKCDSCNTNLVNKWDKQEVWLLSCGHVFHARCISKTDGQCCICYKENEVLDALQSLRQTRGRSGSANQDDTVQEMRQARIKQLKQAVEVANVESRVKSRKETQEERTDRLMKQHDEQVLTDGYLTLDSFEF